MFYSINSQYYCHFSALVFSRGCRPQPPENPQQQEKPRSTVETLQARWAPGVQAGVQAGASHSPSLADIAIHRSVRSQWAVSSSGARMGSAPSGTGTQAEEKCNHSHAPWTEKLATPLQLEHTWLQAKLSRDALAEAWQMRRSRQ